MVVRSSTGHNRPDGWSSARSSIRHGMTLGGAGHGGGTDCGGGTGTSGRTRQWLCRGWAVVRSSTGRGRLDGATRSTGRGGRSWLNLVGRSWVDTKPYPSK
jgi:hypothetical protein